MLPKHILHRHAKVRQQQKRIGDLRVPSRFKNCCELWRNATLTCGVVVSMTFLANSTPCIGRMCGLTRKPAAAMTHVMISGNYTTRFPSCSVLKHTGSDPQNGGTMSVAAVATRAHPETKPQSGEIVYSSRMLVKATCFGSFGLVGMFFAFY